ncbi:MAG: DUF3160 domain-containing protein [Salinivirgaceae bacterium]|nr:DUF3160 domain-containing protein [Salinivirgaceae bacterium]
MRTYKPFKQILPITVSIALIFGTLACNKSNKKGNGSESVTNTETGVSKSDNDEAVRKRVAVKLDKLKKQMAKYEGTPDHYGLSFDFDKFYCNPNYDIALDSFSFEELRLLRSIPYARNGHWFKEGEICEKLLTIKQYIQDLKPVAKQHAKEKHENNFSEYWKLWDEDYPKTYSLISLNDEEQAFVARVDECIAEWEKLRYVDVDGVILPNSQLLYNKSYVDIADDKFWNNLQKQNFAISSDQYSHLFNPYELYDNLPVYVTTDLYLHTYHKYFSWLLKELETKHFLPAIIELCNKMYDNSLQAIDEPLDPTEKILAANAATFYAIAIKLASGEDVENLPESMRESYNSELSKIMAESDGSSAFMGTDYFAYSLFKPRGNYTRTEESRRYFKAMMWLQTASFNLQQTLYLAYQFELSSSEIKDKYFSVLDPVTFLMGEPDNVSIAEIADIIDTELGINTVADICNQQKVKQAQNIIVQKFAEHSKINSYKGVEINFMPQRYVPDNEVLGTMYDSVPNADRAYPSGLDVFDAFGSATAANILDSTDNGTKTWDKYNEKSTKMRGKFSQYSNFDKTMYNKWFESLIVLQKKNKDWPGHMQTSAWERKNMNAALGSWAELKHDAILYSEQPDGAEMGGGGPDDYYYAISLPAPEYFQNYLEPNLLFWEKMKEMLNLNVQMLKKAGYDGWLQSSASNLMRAVEEAIEISKKELKGEKLTKRENDYLEKTGGEFEYMTLLYMNDYALNSWDQVEGADTCVAVVADVFTRSIDGCDKNGILYEAIGNANTIYVVVEHNNQIYLTRGGVYDYREFVGSLGNRLTDEEWQTELSTNPTKGRPSWMKDLYTNKLTKINKKAGDRDCPFWLIHVYMKYDKEKDKYIDIEELADDSTYNDSSFLEDDY